MKRSILAIGVLAALAPACARGPEGGGGGPIEHPRGASELVLRVDTSGGLIPLELRLSELPQFSLYGDGRLTTEGPQIEIYPQPALPNLQQRSVSEEGVQAILRAADEAGLLGADHQYTSAEIFDATGTTFTVYAGGEKHETFVYALGYPGTETGGAEGRARRMLSDFANSLADPAAWLPAGSAGPEKEYSPEALRVFVMGRPEPPTDPNLEQPAMEWPLEDPLARFGAPFEDYPDTRCGTVEGGSLDELRPRVQTANQLTPWRSDGETFKLVFRPLLPDEESC